MHEGTLAEYLRVDREHVWHPYAALPSAEPRYLVSGASGVHLELADGTRLVDAMSSWWTALFGYAHPELLRAAHQQLAALPHVMFGGLTHEPAIRLTQKLLELAPPGLDRVFFSDSGSVSVEVAMKMAFQYAAALGQPQRRRFLTLRCGYHGDTWGAMSLCDPGGMHRLFAGAVAQQVFAPAPRSAFGAPCDASDISALEALARANQGELCAVILEPVVQNAGGMRFYSADYLREVRRVCDDLGLLLIADEIATGFGRTGKLFACEHAAISPDIMCIGKALTGGTLSFAATLTTQRVATTISRGAPGLFMHGPTYMANPLACAVACRVLDLLRELDWRARVAAIEKQLASELEGCRSHPDVADVRVLGAIGVIEMKRDVDAARAVPAAVARGVWLRPFGRLLYTMPPFVTEEPELRAITSAISAIAREPALR